jgi:hypothetical protein
MLTIVWKKGELALALSCYNSASVASHAYMASRMGCGTNTNACKHHDLAYFHSHPLESCWGCDIHMRFSYALLITHHINPLAPAQSYAWHGKPYKVLGMENPKVLNALSHFLEKLKQIIRNAIAARSLACTIAYSI